MNDSNGYRYLAEVPGVEMEDQMIHVGLCKTCGAVVEMDFPAFKTSTRHSEWHATMAQRVVEIIEANARLRASYPAGTL